MTKMMRSVMMRVDFMDLTFKGCWFIDWARVGIYL